MGLATKNTVIASHASELLPTKRSHLASPRTVRGLAPRAPKLSSSERALPTDGLCCLRFDSTPARMNFKVRAVGTRVRPRTPREARPCRPLEPLAALMRLDLLVETPAPDSPQRRRSCLFWGVARRRSYARVKEALDTTDTWLQNISGPEFARAER
jgi:hypothetical protein